MAIWLRIVSEWVYVLLWLEAGGQQQNLGPLLLQTLGLILTAIGTYYASTFKSRKEAAALQDKQTDALVAGWGKMTDQAQAIIARLQSETVEAVTRANSLERELREVRAKYEAALTELEELRRQAQGARKRRAT